MSSYVRRLVSGPKARFKDAELDVELDLVYFTDRIIIMGFPATGVEGFYRNPRAQVKRFLDTRHGENYRIFNFCPIRENSYDAQEFGGRVSRWPFPDHHAPPLPILALASQEMVAWLKRSEDAVVVLHCKAGKGRSGTLACALLLALEEKVAPPKLERSYNQSEWADIRANQLMDEVKEVEQERYVTGNGTETDNNNVGTESDAPVLSEKPIVETPAQLTPANSIPSPQSKKPSPNESLDEVLKLHTSRRMKKTSARLGVSIASQRRWLRYWSEILYGAAPPQLWSQPSNKTSLKARIHHVNVRMKASGGGPTVAVVRVANALLDRAPKRGAQKDRGAGDVWVSLARYNDELVEELEQRVLKRDPDYDYENGTGISKKSLFADDKWDNNKMVRSFARMGSLEGSEPEETKDEDGARILKHQLYPVPSSEWVTVDDDDDEEDAFNMNSTVDSGAGVVIDATREVRIKLYKGQVFMGWAWLIPCFHLPQPARQDSTLTQFVLPRSEIDFPLGFGALLIDVEIVLGWAGYEEAAPVPSVETPAQQEPATAGILAAVGGDVEALQGARD